VADCFAYGRALLGIAGHTTCADGGGVALATALPNLGGAANELAYTWAGLANAAIS
jgi:hypothetical protein